MVFTDCPCSEEDIAPSLEGLKVFSKLARRR